MFTLCTGLAYLLLAFHLVYTRGDQRLHPPLRFRQNGIIIHHFLRHGEQIVERDLEASHYQSLSSITIGVVVVVPLMSMVAVQWKWNGKPSGSLYVTVTAPVSAFFESV